MGFTLLELMLAITIGALVLSAAYSTFSVGIDTQRRVTRVAGETQAWRFFAERLRADVKNLALRRGASVTGDAQTLALLSVPPGRAPQQVSYRYRRAAAGGQIRRGYRTPSDAVVDNDADDDNAGVSARPPPRDRAEVETLVFDGVERFALRYLVDGEWRDAVGADDDGQHTLPQALECTVRSGGRERRLVVAIEVQHAAG